MNILKEKDLSIKYGMINYGDEREEAKHSFCYIANDILDIKQNYFRLGFHLQEFFDFGYYRDFGYPSMKEFIEKNTDLKYNTVKHCMTVYNKFCRRNENGTKTMFIEDKYEGYSYSQLQEMSSMTPNQLNVCNKDMTISEMRALKRKDKESAGVGTCDNKKAIQEELCVIEEYLRNEQFEPFMYEFFGLLEKATKEHITGCEVSGKTLKFSHNEKKYKIVLSVMKD